MRRWHFYALTLIFFVGILALDVALLLRPDELRGHLDRVLRANVKTDIEVGDIEFTGFGGVRFSDVTIYRARESSDPVLTCREVVVSLDPWKLIQGEVELSRVELVQPTVMLRWDAQGRLDIPSILQSEDTKARTGRDPVIEIEDLSLAFENSPFFNPEADTRLSGIDIRLSPRLSRSYRYRVEGSVDDEVFGRFTIDGSFGAAEVFGTVRRRNLTLNDRLVRHLSPAMQEVVSKIDMTGRLDLEVEVSSRDFLDTVEITGKAVVDDVSLAYRDWPAEIEQLEGEFRYERGRVLLDGSSFSLQGGRVEVKSGEIDFNGETPKFRVHGHAQGIDIDRDFAARVARFPEPGGDISDVLRAIGADGRVDLEFTLEKEATSHKVDVDIWVTFRQANLCFIGFENEEGEPEGFPYPLSKVIGTVHVTNHRVEFDNIRTNQQFPNVKARGRIDFDDDGVKIDVEIRGENLRLDPDLRVCLEENERQVYDDFDPSGPVDFLLDVKRPKTNETGATRVNLTVQLQGCTARPSLFPYRLEDIRGTLQFGDDHKGTLVKGVTAVHDATSIQIDGWVDLANRTDPGYDLVIDADDVALDEDLLHGIDAEFSDIATQIRRFNMEGAVDFDCHILTANEGRDNKFTVNMTDRSSRGRVAFAHEDFPRLRFTGVSGSIVAEGDRVRLEGVTMFHRSNEFEARGWLDAASGYHDVTLRSRDFAVDDATLALAERIIPEVAAVTDDVHIAGQVDLTLYLKKTDDGEGVRSRIVANGITLRGEEIPWQVRDVFGSVTIGPGEVTFANWVGVVPLPARAGLPARETTVSIKSGDLIDGNLLLLSVHLDEVRLDRTLFDLLPDDLAGTLTDLGLYGTLSAEFDAVEVVDGQLRIAGRVKPSHVGLEPGFPLRLDGCVFKLEDARFGNGVFLIRGDLSEGDVHLGPFLLPDLHAKIDVDREAFAIKDITCSALGGKVTEGFFRVGLAEGSPFKSKVVLEKVDIATFVRELGGNPKQLTGRATVNADMEGMLSDTKTWTGHGFLEVKGNDLWSLPVVGVVLTIINFDFLTMSGDEVQQGRVQARIENEQLKLTEASFTGPGINLELDGDKGTVGFDGLCDVTFNLQVIKWLDSIPIIGDIVGFGRSFFLRSVRVQGPIEDPQATVGSVINDILPTEEDTGRRLKIRPLKKRPKQEQKKDKEKRP